jgi:hypothetical protein
MSLVLFNTELDWSTALSNINTAAFTWDAVYSICVKWSYGMNTPWKKTYTSIVQKITSRSVTGQRLGLTVQTQGENLIHLSWNSGFRTGSYENCIARHTKQSPAWYGIINQIRWGVLGGLCKWVFGTITGYDNKTIEEVWFHTYPREEIGVEFHRRCRVNFSLEIGENYRRSMFLEDVRMLLLELVHSTSGERWVISDSNTLIRTLFRTIYLNLYHRFSHCKVIDY